MAMGEDKWRAWAIAAAAGAGIDVEGAHGTA